MTNEKNKVVLKPCANAKVLLNGNEIKDKKELHHNDRVMFGHNHFFVFHHPQDMAKQQKSKAGVTPTPSYDSAQEEIAKNSGITKLAGQGKSPGKYSAHYVTCSFSPLLLHSHVGSVGPRFSMWNFLMASS